MNCQIFTQDFQQTSNCSDYWLWYTGIVSFPYSGFGVLLTRSSHSVSFDSLMPTFLSEPIMDSEPSLPFKFSGGFALSTKTIGFMMAVQGVYSMIAQLWLFPFLIRRLGTLATFRIVIAIWPLLYLVVPYLVLLPRHVQTTGIYLCLLMKITFHLIAFP